MHDALDGEELTRRDFDMRAHGQGGVQSERVCNHRKIASVAASAVAIAAAAAAAVPAVRSAGRSATSIAVGLAERTGGAPTDTTRTQAQKANSSLPNML